MKAFVTRSLLLLGLLGSVGGAWAQPHWRDLPPEERRHMRQQMREHWQHERQHERELRREEAPPRWRDLPMEDRRRLRDEMREQRGLPEHHDFRGGGRGGGRRD
ncbi:MAG: hypothetical protein KUL81_06650 [Azonexus sp.]|jgi:hypothetical protein|nr:hypothetical protein [Azonexus sp.]